MNVEIIPAILPRDFAEIEQEIGLIHGFVKTIQIDVCDGQFTPTASWPYRKHDDSFDKLIHEQEGFPGWQDEDFEIDLMANRPEELVDDWVMAGAARIIIHVEATGDIGKAIDSLQGRVEVGVALNEDTPITILEEPRFGVHEGKVGFVQLMGIDRIGYQHQPFDDRVLGRIKEVRLKYPAMPISVDGGVLLETAPGLIAAGASRLVVGSAIFGAENAIDAIHSFKQLA